MAGFAERDGAKENVPELAWRRIVLTGGASGIGAATARLFVQQGARLTLLDRDRAALETIAAELGCNAVSADITDDDEVDRAMTEAAAEMGGIDGLVHAAGIMSSAAFANMTRDHWRNVIDVNLNGTFLVCHAAREHLMRAQQGTIVTIASGQALLPGASGSAYAASKGAVMVFSKALAAELAPAIRVNTVCPGAVDTPMAAQAFAGLDHAQIEAVKARYALKRLSTADEIAEAILFLTGRRSSSITGIALAVDCGRTFH